MSAGSTIQSFQMLRALREDLLDADDCKIRKIVALLERAPVNKISQAVLNPLRPRLAILKPNRPLRFTRLLFTPLNDLIVPASDWKPGQAAIPHSIMQSVSDTVQAAMAGDTEEIRRMIAGHNTGETEILTRSGQMLWAGAAEILAQAPEPLHWAETGLRPAAYPPLARSIATVLRRAVALRLLFRQAEIGMLKPDEGAIRAIILNLAAESPEGQAMVFKLMLGRLPHAAALLRQCAESNWTTTEKMLLQTAVDRGTEDILADMESQSALTKKLCDGALGDVGSEVQRIAGLLEDITDSARTNRDRLRTHALGEKLDAVCRGRFVEGLKTCLVAPLAAATAPVDSEGQKQFENHARDLRAVEMVGRRLGNATAYDGILSRASEAVRLATASGHLSPLRAVRLVEILSGPEAAEAMYTSAAASAARAR
jgi:hypothetical protein